MKTRFGLAAIVSLSKNRIVLRARYIDSDLDSASVPRKHRDTWPSCWSQPETSFASAGGKMNFTPHPYRP